MDETPILVEKRAGYRVITLNRPQRLNAFNEAMHKALAPALAEAEEDQARRALLLTGAGRGFCAGQDLNDRLAKPGERVARLREFEQCTGYDVARRESEPAEIAQSDGGHSRRGIALLTELDFKFAGQPSAC